MKRYGYIIEEIIDYSNIAESFDYVLRGRKRKRSQMGRWLIKHREEVIADLQKRIGNGTFRVTFYRTHHITERGKNREIQSVALKERIALNAIMKVVEKYLDKRFIVDSAASIKGRGTHYLLRRIIHAMRTDPEGTSKAYKNDITKFYHSIIQTKMMFVIRQVFKDKRLLDILESCVTMLAEGLSIGLRSSQALGNLLLDYYVDHILKDEMAVRYYFRYCDDSLAMTDSWQKLTQIVGAVKQCISEAGLTIKENEQCFSTKDRAVDFLGYKIGVDGRVKIRKHIKQRFARRWKRVKSKKRKRQLIGSFYGQVKHCHGRHLFKTITGISMRSFAEFGLTYESADGKKHFDVPSKSLGELQNVAIVVKDYERDITTKQGANRYVVLFELEGVEYKFITNSEELKQMLDKASEIEDAFPFQTTIKRKAFGNGHFKYSFT